MSCPRLPPELCDLVIGWLEGDGEILRACALVCRSWLPASRHHLFQAVYLFHETQYKLFTHRILQDQNMKPYLDSMRGLTIWPHPEPLPNQLPSGDEGAYRRTLSRSFFFLFGGRLPSLEVLTLVNLDWKDLPRPSEPLLLSTFPSITTIQFSACYLPSFSFLRRALMAMSSLTHLIVEHVQWPIETASSVPSSIGAPHFVRLAITRFSVKYWEGNDTPVKQLLQWFMEARAWRQLRELSFTVERFQEYRFSESNPLGEVQDTFLKVVGPKVIDLSVSMRGTQRSLYLVRA